MRIAVDARALSAERSGVGRYLEGLLGAWVRLYPGDSFVLLSPGAIAVPPPLAGKVELAPSRLRLPGTLWLQASAASEARRAGAELFFGPLGVVPFSTRLPSVATVHDLTPLLFPEWHRLKNRLGFNPFLAGTVRRARGIAAVSEATRRDLVAWLPEAGPRCVVVPNGVTPFEEAGTPAPGSPARSVGRGARERPYVLYLGTIEPRKNLERLVLALESIWDRRPGFPDLVLAGGMGWGMDRFPGRLESSRHAGRISWLGYVTGADGARLLREARLLAYPSLYEGFGLPVLEAMAAGTVVVASSSSSLPEVAGDAALLPDPASVPAIAAALERAEDDEAWRRDARRKGLARALLFTWDGAARKMHALFQEALT